jgi:hypothetical protein
LDRRRFFVAQRGGQKAIHDAAWLTALLDHAVQGGWPSPILPDFVVKTVQN